MPSTDWDDSVNFVEKRNRTLLDLREAWDNLRRDANAVLPADSPVLKLINDGVVVADSLTVDAPSTGVLASAQDYAKQRTALQAANTQAAIHRIWAAPSVEAIRGVQLVTGTIVRPSRMNLDDWHEVRDLSRQYLPLAHDLRRSILLWGDQWDYDLSNSLTGDSAFRNEILLTHAQAQLERAKAALEHPEPLPVVHAVEADSGLTGFLVIAGFGVVTLGAALWFATRDQKPAGRRRE